MAAKGPESMHRTARWLTSRPSWLFLTAGDERLTNESPGRFRYAWWGLIVLSLLIGLAAMGVWAATWWLFGEPYGRILPAVTVAGFLLLGPMRGGVTSLGRIVFADSQISQGLLAGFVLLAMTAGLLALQRDNYYQDAPLPVFLAWIRPMEKIYRVLLLMPLWGAWSMLIMPQFCRQRAATQPPVRRFAQGCGAVASVCVWVALLALTITYFSFLDWGQLWISAATAAGAIAAGMIFCRLCGGLTRPGLLATNVVTQLLLLLAYVAGRHFLVHELARH